MPSYREGFAPLFRGSCLWIPSIVSNIYGLSDAVVDGETGLLFEKKNINDLTNKIEFFMKTVKF